MELCIGWMVGLDGRPWLAIQLTHQPSNAPPHCTLSSSTCKPPGKEARRAPPSQATMRPLPKEGACDAWAFFNLVCHYVNFAQCLASCQLASCQLVWPQASWPLASWFAHQPPNSPLLANIAFLRHSSEVAPPTFLIEPGGVECFLQVGRTTSRLSFRLLAYASWQGGLC